MILTRGVLQDYARALKDLDTFNEDLFFKTMRDDYLRPKEEIDFTINIISLLFNCEQLFFRNIYGKGKPIFEKIRLSICQGNTLFKDTPESVKATLRSRVDLDEIDQAAKDSLLLYTLYGDSLSGILINLVNNKELTAQRIEREMLDNIIAYLAVEVFSNLNVDLYTEMVTSYELGYEVFALSAKDVYTYTRETKDNTNNTDLTDRIFSLIGMVKLMFIIPAVLLLILAGHEIISGISLAVQTTYEKLWNNNSSSIESSLSNTSASYLSGFFTDTDQPITSITYEKEDSEFKAKLNRQPIDEDSERVKSQKIITDDDTLFTKVIAYDYPSSYIKYSIQAYKESGRTTRIDDMASRYHVDRTRMLNILNKIVND